MLVAGVLPEGARIVEARCMACHQAGGIAPMAFDSVRAIRPWAKAMSQSIRKGTMPPWHADEASSEHLAQVRALTEGEKKTLLTWLDSPDLSKQNFILTPPRAAAGWQLGTPDLILRIPAAEIPAAGTLQYTFLVSRLNFETDRWIAAAEWKIDQTQVVHHINAFVRPPGSSYVREAPVGQLYVASRAERAARRPEEREIDRRELLLGYEPGYQPQGWGAGRAKLIRAGSDMVFEIHYTANGKATRDSSELGLYFARSAPRERVLTISPADANLVIPPGEANYESRVSATLLDEAKLVSMQPHMHLRGKAYRIELNGTRRLLDVPRYDFNWQTTYFFKEPLLLRKGDTLQCTGWFDNSANNRFNPDATKTIYWGDQSWEEMNVGFMEIAIPAGRDADVVKLSGTTRPAGGRAENPR
ncbi:MAG: c-type cytochrome [Acidobacteriota bacterium]|jgi:hypothetical protein